MDPQAAPSTDQKAYDSLMLKLAPLSNAVAHAIHQNAIVVGWGISVSLDSGSIKPAVELLEQLGATVEQRKGSGVLLSYEGSKIAVRGALPRLSEVSF